MAYSPIPPLDDLTIREWNELTSTIKKTINFCQSIGLLHVYPTERCRKKHNNWYLGACAKSADKWKWRCRTCKSSRSLRAKTFFSNSRLTLQQILDLMMYWCQGLNSHEFISYLIALIYVEVYAISYFLALIDQIKLANMFFFLSSLYV